MIPTKGLSSFTVAHALRAIPRTLPSNADTMLCTDTAELSIHNRKPVQRLMLCTLKQYVTRECWIGQAQPLPTTQQGQQQEGNEVLYRPCYSGSPVAATRHSRLSKIALAVQRKVAGCQLYVDAWLSCWAHHVRIGLKSAAQVQ